MTCNSVCWASHVIFLTNHSMPFFRFFLIFTSNACSAVKGAMLWAIYGTMDLFNFYIECFTIENNFKAVWLSNKYKLLSDILTTEIKLQKTKHMTIGWDFLVHSVDKCIGLVYAMIARDFKGVITLERGYLSLISSISICFVLFTSPQGGVLSIVMNISVSTCITWKLHGHVLSMLPMALSSSVVIC